MPKKNRKTAKCICRGTHAAREKMQWYVQNFEYSRLREHIGHSIACVCYSKDGQDPRNVSLECEDCCEVLYGVNRPEVR